jgi:hypothetical protein
LFTKQTWLDKGFNNEKLTEHMEKYLAERAADTESEALKSLIPGFIVQPRYKSCVEFEGPLEMRVVTLWGKARIGIWWWGRQVPGRAPTEGKKPQRTAWVVRKSSNDGLENAEDNWEILHEHKGENKGFETSLQLFLQAMPAMAVAAESIAKAVGAPFLRSDFFVGSEKWGVRLNEVAYGSGCDCRRRGDAPEEALDDAPFIARILQEGFKHCKVLPAKHFMDGLGAEEVTYNSLVVNKRRTRTLSQDKTVRPRLPSLALHGFTAASLHAAMISPVAAADCNTVSHKSEMLTSSSAVAISPAARQQPVNIPVRPHSVVVPAARPAAVPGAKRMMSIPHRINAQPQSSPVLLGRQGVSMALGAIAEMPSLSMVPSLRRG